MAYAVTAIMKLPYVSNLLNSPTSLTFLPTYLCNMYSCVNRT